MANSSISVLNQAGTPVVMSGVTDAANGAAFLPAQVAADPLNGFKKTIGEGRANYQYSVPDFAPVATPTAIVVIQGSATKTVEIKRLSITGGATAAGSMRYLVTRRSTAGTLGSAVLTAVTAAKRDTGNPAATAVVSSVGTANYTTPGTTAGELASGRVNLVAIGSAATSSDCQPVVLEFGVKDDQPLRLNGVSDWITIEGGGSAIPSGGKWDITVTTVEY